MSTGTNIEWTDATWNPIVGCSKVSAGCRNCYAISMAWRIRSMSSDSPYRNVVEKRGYDPNWTGKLAFNASALDAPRRWRKSKRVFVNSMGDLFHEDTPLAWIDRVFDVMRDCPHHRFQILTKRPDIMRDYMRTRGKMYGLFDERLLQNVWLGVSVEDQESAVARIPILLDTRAAVRFVSCEPLIGSIDLTWLDDAPTELLPMNALTGIQTNVGPRVHVDETNRLDWVIVGGESGPGARICRIEWIEAIVGQCSESGVPVFVKQIGSIAVRGGLRHRTMSMKGGDPGEWPENIRVREYPRDVPA